MVSTASYNFTIDDLSKNDLIDLMAECRNDSKLLAKVLFPEEFYKPFAAAHDEIFCLLDKSPSKKKVIAAPRGIGKSMIANLVVKKHILFGSDHYIGYLSDSLGKAEQETENIKSSLLGNEKVRKMFPPITTKYYEGGNEDSFSKKSWVAYGQTMIMPRGSGQQVNGLRWLQHRPNWVIDDFEDVREVMNEVQRGKTREWFYGALMNTISRFDKNYWFLYIDTIKHQDALIVELLKDPDWEHLQLSLCTDDYQTLMPDFISQEELDSELEAHRRKRILDLFAMNFMSKATSPEDRSFSDLFQYYSETDEEFQKRLPSMINILIVDPAKTEKTHNAQSGFVVWGIDLDRQAYYVRQAFGDYYRTDKVCEVCFQLADQYNVDAIGFEVTGLEGWGIYTLKNHMSGRGGKQYHIEELKAKGGKGQLGGQDGAKIGRVNFGLLPLYEQGLVYHNRIGTGQLEQQELSFPRPERWDVLDAAAYIAPMLEKVLMYISPADWEKKVEGEIDKNIEREYEGLYDEPTFHRKEVGYYGY